jgi:hypothetical protein
MTDTGTERELSPQIKGGRKTAMTGTVAATQVFISYARADEDFAKALSLQLTKRGLSVWNAAAEVLPGDNFGLQTGEALRKSRAMVVLVSPDSMRSENVRHEIEYALGDPNYEHRVFPVHVRPTEDMPWILRRFKSFDAQQSAAKVSESIANALK